MSAAADPRPPTSPARPSTSAPPTTPAPGAAAAAWTASGVPLAPLGNEHIVGVASGRLLDADGCRMVLDAIAAAEDGAPSAPSSAAPTAVDAAAPDLGAAVAGRWLPDAVGSWLLPMIGQAVTVANNQHFRFELTGIVATDPTVVMTMGPDDGELGRQLLSDLLPTASTRKLTVVLPLTEGTGGNPEFPALDKAGTDVPGELSIFPSYLSYRLRPVTGEPRVFLWARVHGPHFQ